MPVEYLKTKADYDNALKADKLVVIDFTASWCPPCKMIAPKFEALAEEHTDCNLHKVDVDENGEASQAAGIQCMPTFKFYKGGQEVDKLEGASEEKLKELIAKHK